MHIDLKFIIFLYIILISLLYIYKPQIFNLYKNKNKKLLYIMFLMVVFAIISYYVKVLFEYFL